MEKILNNKSNNNNKSNKPTVILAIESSCDETSVAILVDNKLKANIVSSQIKEHIPFKGVYPELAARLHVEKIDYVIVKAISEADIAFTDIDYIVVTQGPGLPSALQIGMMGAKTLASYLNVPLIGVHHLAGHIYANEYVEGKEIIYPSLGVIISGGNTEIVLIKDVNKFELLGCTLDDAIGEALDKIARKLDLPYPGGVAIDRLTCDCKDSIKTFKLPTIKVDNYNVSYSGIKSHLARLIDKEKEETFVSSLDIERVKEIAFTAEKGLIDQLLNKVKKAITDFNIKQVVFGGGVSANSYLREQVSKDLIPYFNNEVEFIIPPLWCTTDNAAMIAKIGQHLINNKEFTSLTCSTSPSLKLNK